MSKRIVWLIVLVMPWATLACMGISLPKIRRMRTGPEVTDEIRVPLPDGGGPRNVEIGMGMGTLTVEPGAENALVAGTVTYNAADLKPEVTVNGDKVRILQGRVEGIPEFDEQIKNDWDLALGAAPMALTINAGATVADVELGGLALTDVTVSQGASDFDLAFSEANKTEMDTLRINAGASDMTLSGLANANADKIVFKGGAGNYLMRFDGVLQRDFEVTIDAGLGGIAIIIPEGVVAAVTIAGAMTDVDAVHEWQRVDDGYVLEGEGYEISLHIKMGLGNLELRNK